MNDITALRRHLFETLAALKDKNNPMDIDRAKAVSEVAQTIINSAKVEVDHLKLTGGIGSGFLPAPEPGALRSGSTETPTGVKTVSRLPAGGTVTQHKLR